LPHHPPPTPLAREPLRRQESPGGAVPDGHVVVPLELGAVVEGLRDKAKQGQANAAAQLLAYLRQFPPVMERGDQDMAARGLEELDPAEQAEFEAWALRRWQRAQQRLERMRQPSSPRGLDG
jgi:hypothetical protein